MEKEYKRTNYASDLTDRQWEEIKEFFPTGNKSKYNKRSLVEAVLYSHSTYIQNYKDIKKHSEQNHSKICDDVKTLLFCVLKHTGIFQQDSVQENTAGEI